MKDGKQKNGEDFLTQPIHVLEHPMPLNPKLSILSKTNWWWLSNNPLTWQLLQIHTKVLIEILTISGVRFCNSWTLIHSYSLKTSINKFFEMENLIIHSLVSNVQQSRMGVWVGFQRKDLEVCTTHVGNQLEANDVKELISTVWLVSSQKTLAAFSSLNNSTMIHM